nr:MAG TPA: hypothetical protein [Bacteriophage sp.]
MCMKSGENSTRRRAKRYIFHNCIYNITNLLQYCT